MTLRGIVQMLAALAPLVKSGVEAAEQVFGPMKGAEKLAEATRRVEAAIPKVAELAGHVEAARAAVKPMIEATVAAANASGAFKKTARPPKSRRRKK